MMPSAASTNGTSCLIVLPVFLFPGNRGQANRLNQSERNQLKHYFSPTCNNPTLLNLVGCSTERRLPFCNCRLRRLRQWEDAQRG